MNAASSNADGRRRPGMAATRSAGWPIFGRPRQLLPPSPSDFGKHVAALGQLLARTQDHNYAQSRLAQYRQIAERKSGRSHLKSK